MATGDTLCVFTPLHNEPPASTYATLDARNQHPCLDFDAASDETAVFTGLLPANYSGGGLTLILIWGATTADVNNCRWDAQIERMEDEGTDLDADSFAAVQSVTATAPSPSGGLQYSTITFSSGAQMDSLAAAEMFRLKIIRDANHAADTMTGDAELFGAILKET